MFYATATGVALSPAWLTAAGPGTVAAEAFTTALNQEAAHGLPHAADHEWKGQRHTELVPSRVRRSRLGARYYHMRHSSIPSAPFWNTALFRRPRPRNILRVFFVSCHDRIHRTISACMGAWRQDTVLADARLSHADIALTLCTGNLLGLQNRVDVHVIMHLTLAQIWRFRHLLGRTDSGNVPTRKRCRWGVVIFDTSSGSPVLEYGGGTLVL